MVCRHILAVAVLAVIPSMATAQPRDVRADRQALLNRTLTQTPIENVIGQRASCASGQQAASVARRRSAGFAETPDAADYCVTLLTRLGRNGRLMYVRDTRGAMPTAALAFDNGFVAAYRKGEALPAALPTMGTLKPVAERCLSQREPDIDLCQSVGYALGARAAQGELVVVR